MAKKVTLRKFLEACRVLGEDIDIYVDGIDGVAYCGTLLTEEGERHFKKALDLEMNGCVVIGNDSDYDKLMNDKPNNLSLAWELLYGMAGYCPSSLWDEWFTNEEE